MLDVRPQGILHIVIPHATIARMINLLERKSELTEIRALMRHGGVMVVEGKAGLGKTAMLDAACALAGRQRRLVFRARGSDLERDFPLGLVRQLFERYCADATEDCCSRVRGARSALCLFPACRAVSSKPQHSPFCTGFIGLQSILRHGIAS